MILRFIRLAFRDGTKRYRFSCLRLHATADQEEARAGLFGVREMSTFEDKGTGDFVVSANAR